MFNIDKQSNFSLTEKLLYNVWMELRELNKPTDIITELCKEESPQYKCKICNKAYDNKGELLACAKKHKRKG